MPKTRFMVVSVLNVGDGEEVRGFGVVDEVVVEVEVRRRVGVEFVFAGGVSIVGVFLGGEKQDVLEIGRYIAGEQNL